MVIGGAGLRCVNGVLDKVQKQLFDPSCFTNDGKDIAVHVLQQDDQSQRLMRRTLLGNDLLEQIEQGKTFEQLLAARPDPGRQPGEQIVDLAERVLQRRHHIGTKRRIVGMTLGIARHQRQLADELLDVMKDEGKAAIELVELARLVERDLCRAFGNLACRLPAQGAQQLEILPIERPLEIGAFEHEKTRERIMVDQRHAEPEPPVGDRPIG